MAPKKILKDYGHIEQFTTTIPSIKWTIDDFFTIFSRNQKVNSISPIFSTEDNYKHRWAMQLLIDNSSDKPILKLRLVSYNNAYVAFRHLQFSVHLSLNQLARRVMKKTEFFKSGSFVGFTFSGKQIRTSKKTLTLNAKLLIFCTMMDLKSTKSTDFHEIPIKVLDDYESLFLNNNHCDAILVASGREFPVHKVILSARSSVFSAMFEHDMKEKQDGKATIEGIKADVLQELLRYIYVGKVKKIDVLCKDLLMAADMYAIEGLKTACLNYMFKTISVENAVDLLIFSDKHIVDKLKTLTMEYIVKNAKLVVKTESFKKLKNLEASIALELFERLAFTQSS